MSIMTDVEEYIRKHKLTEFSVQDLTHIHKNTGYLGELLRHLARLNRIHPIGLRKIGQSKAMYYAPGPGAADGSAVCLLVAHWPVAVLTVEEALEQRKQRFLKLYGEY